MFRNIRLAAFRHRARMVLVIMVAVVTSMTLHHGAMASTAVPGIATVEQHHGSQESALCAGPCRMHSHEIPACCGMGLCLSALPTPPQAGMPATTFDRPLGTFYGLVPRWSAGRIDRPPKFLGEAAV